MNSTAPGNPCGDVWRLPEGVQLLWQTWDDEVIVFNTASGQTHLLDALSATALRDLERGPRTLAQLAGAMAGRFDLEPEILSNRLVEICARFDQLGLAEPARK